MSKKLIFHIGLHKTATTFFQDVVFPELKHWNYLDRPYVQNNFAFNKLQYEDDSLYDSQHAVNEIEHIEGDYLLFSSEDLTGHPWMSAINRSQVARRLRALSEDCEIILFIRGQRKILYSHYNNFINNYQGIRKIEEFVWKPQANYTYDMYKKGCKGSLQNSYYNMAWFSINVDNFLYYNLIKYYKYLFGDKLHVFLYEEFSQTPDRVFDKLEYILEEKIDPSVKEKAYKKKVNKSVSNHELHKQLIVNKVTAGYKNRYINKISETAVNLALMATPSTGQNQETTYLDELVKEYYVENNRKIVEEYPEIGLQNFPEAYDF